MTLRSIPLAATLALALACTSSDDTGADNDTGATTADAASPYCEDEETAMAPEDEALGTTGAAFLEAVPAESVVEAVWADGAAAEATVTLAVDSASLRSVVSTAVYPETEGPSSAIGVECPDYLALDATVTLATSDGRLDETLSTTLVLDEYSVADSVITFFAELDPAGLTGTLDLDDFADVASYDEVTMSMWATVQGGVVSGTVSAMGSGTDGNVAFAENIEVLTLAGELD